MGEPWVAGERKLREPRVYHLSGEPLELILGDVELLQSSKVDDLRGDTS